MTVVAKRIDVVWLDLFTRDTGLTQGNMVSGSYKRVPGFQNVGDYEYSLDGEPERPQAPRGKFALAYVTIEKESQSITGAPYTHNVTDITNTARPSSNFGSSSDFQVSQASGRTFDVSGGTHTGDGLVTQASSTSAVRNTLSWNVPTGQYDVRLRRETSDSSSDRVRDEVQWTAFRSIKDTEPVDATFASNYNIAQTQVVIKATDQLNGIVDQFNGVPSSILPDYDPDSDSWVERTTANCASIARDIWQGNASKKPVPDSQLDIATLEALWQRCHDRLMQFNGVIQGGSAEDALKQVLSNARASRTLVDGIRSVVIDQEKTDVVQHFTPRNSRNFRGSKRFAKQPHALKVRFQNRLKGYQPDEVIVYDDGYSADGTNCEFNASDGSCSVATEFETLDTKGIVLGEQAYQYGRYQLATNKLRPENYELDVDIEHLVATPGDLIAVTHDVPIFGLAAGRVKSIQTSGTDTTGVTLDETLELAANTDYTIRFRLSNGDSVTRDLEQVGTDTETQTVTFTTAIATSSGPAVGDLAQFGLLDQETVFCIIKGITGGDPDWGATLTLVDHAQPGIDDSADSAIPPFESNITDNPFTRQRPPQPQIEEIRSDESALVRHRDGSLEEAIAVSYRIPSSDQFQVEGAQFRFRKFDESASWEYQTGQPQQGTINLRPVDTGAEYEVEGRTLTQSGIASNWVQVAASHEVIGKTTPPPVPDSFEVIVQADGTREFTFSMAETPRDLAGFEVRFVAGSSTDWNAMETLTPQGKLVFSPFESNQVSAGLHSFGVKAFDTTGNESESALFIEQDLPQPRLAGVLVQRRERSLQWPGTRNSMFRDDDNILYATGTWDSLSGTTWGNAGPEWSSWARESPVSYETEVIDLGTNSFFVPRVQISAVGTTTIEMKTGTEADGGVTGSYVALDDVEGARYVQIRVSITGTSPILSSMTTLIDGETVITSRQDVDTSTETADWFNRIGTGHFQIACNDDTGAITGGAITAFQSITSSHWWSLESKTATVDGKPAAEFKVYDDTDTLTDVTVDVELKGPKKAN